MTKALAQKKHPGGAPSKFTPEVFPKIEAYLSMCGREQTTLPTVEGLAGHLGVVRDTLYRWAKESPELSDSLKKLAEKQRQQLMDDGMYGGKEVNASMAIFLLKALHGMKDGSGTAMRVKGDNMTVEYIEYESESKD